MKKNTLLLLFFLCSTIVTMADNGMAGVRGLIMRRVPWLQDKVVLEPLPAADKAELFTLSTRDGKLVIQASGDNVACMALNYYLENYCHRSMSHMGDNLKPVQSLPEIKEPLTKRIELPLRYALNYCTFNYTMSFYQWQDWEHELDWMALHGVNLMLMPVGMEKVWQNTLRKFGCTDAQIRNFIPGPGYTAWWLMGNLEGWGGPVSQDFIDAQSRLGRRILDRMATLGIQPVLQGFYGMVSRSIRDRYPNAVMPQGMWGFFERPDILKPTEKLFDEMADTYYREIRKLYGTGFHYFGGDLFHEGGQTGTLNVADCGLAVQRAMQRNFPGSTWVLQGWSGNPNPLLLTKLDREKVLVVDLFGENDEAWNRTKAYQGTPFLWCIVSNFGEQCGMYGKLQRIALQIDKVRKGDYKAYLKGVGIMPEGINNNPVVYDMVLHAPLTDRKINVEAWLKSYITYRYGSYNADIYAAWLIFLQTVYASVPEKYGLPESVFCARPGVKVTQTSSWGVRARYYDMDFFKEGVRLFLKAKTSFEDSETYAYDMFDLLRQVQSDKGNRAYDNMIAAIDAKNPNRFEQTSDRFLHELLRQDTLLAQSKGFTLERWLGQASRFGKTVYDRDLALKNAKMQLTFWGPDWNPTTTVHDYAAKEWAGMLRTLYYEEWKMFVEAWKKRVRGTETIEPDYYGYQISWCKKPVVYDPPRLDRAQMEALIAEILQ